MYFYTISLLVHLEKSPICNKLFTFDSSKKFSERNKLSEKYCIWYISRHSRNMEIVRSVSWLPSIWLVSLQCQRGPKRALRTGQYCYTFRKWVYLDPSDNSFVSIKSAAKEGIGNRPVLPHVPKIYSRIGNQTAFQWRQTSENIHMKDVLTFMSSKRYATHYTVDGMCISYLTKSTLIFFFLFHIAPWTTRATFHRNNEIEHSFSPLRGCLHRRTISPSLFEYTRKGYGKVMRYTALHICNLYKYWVTFEGFKISTLQRGAQSCAFLYRGTHTSSLASAIQIFQPPTPFARALLT